MGIILWIIFGALVGWVASMIVGSNEEQGVLGNIVVGIVGALLGGALAQALGIGTITGFNLGSFLIALGGAVIVLAVYRALRGRSGHMHSTLHR